MTFSWTDARYFYWKQLEQSKWKCPPIKNAERIIPYLAVTKYKIGLLQRDLPNDVAFKQTRFFLSSFHLFVCLKNIFFSFFVCLKTSFYLQSKSIIFKGKYFLKWILNVELNLKMQSIRYFNRYPFIVSITL